MTDKAKRRLTNINFEKQGSHVALVGPSVGGAANGYTTLITKATDTISQELIEKASTVTVEMQFPEFLRKFFGMYWDDAEVLSAAMGYGRTEYPEEEAEVKDWIDKRVESISILKSVYRAQDVEKALSELTPEQTLAILKDQEMLEKALDNLPEQTKQTLDKEPEMETILKSAHEEFVSKAVTDAVAIEKAKLDAQELVLKAAQDELAVFKAAAEAAVVAVRKAALTAVVPADKVEPLLKAYSVMDDEAFAVAIEAHEGQKVLADQSDMLVEKGVSGSGAESVSEIDRTTEILKAKYQPKAGK